MNKKIKLYLIIACTAQAVSFLAINMTTFMRYAFTKPDNFERMGDLLAISLFIATAATFIVQIACGLWIKKEAKEIGHPHWLWFFFGFCFQWIGVGVFYLYTTYTKNNDTNKTGYTTRD